MMFESVLTFRWPLKTFFHDRGRPLFFILTLFCLACGLSWGTSQTSTETAPRPLRQKYFIAGAPFFLEIVKTPEALKRGLMGRSHVPPQTGMLFLFPKAQRPCFWMKETVVPLDLLFLNNKGQIVELKEGLQPHSLRHHCARHPVKAALEVPAGTVQRFRIRLGMKVKSIP